MISLHRAVWQAALLTIVLLLTIAAGRAETVSVLLLSEPPNSSPDAFDTRLLLERAGEAIGHEIRVEEEDRATGVVVPIWRTLEIGTVAGEPIDVVVGLTIAQIRQLAEVDAEWATMPFAVGDFSPTLFFTGTQRGRSSYRESLVGVPMEITVLMVCFRRDGHLADYLLHTSPSILEIAYGKLTPRVSMPDPRSDAVGRAALISIFLATGSINKGWGVFSEFDRIVDKYAVDHIQSCLDVERGRADIGFTSMAARENIEKIFDGVGTQVIRDGALIPKRFAVAFGHGGELSPGTESLLKWLSQPQLERNLEMLQSRVEQAEWYYDVWAMAFSKSQLNYFAPEQLVDEWTAQFAYKSRFSGKY